MWRRKENHTREIQANQKPYLDNKIGRPSTLSSQGVHIPAGTKAAGKKKIGCFSQDKWSIIGWTNASPGEPKRTNCLKSQIHLEKPVISQSSQDRFSYQRYVAVQDMCSWDFCNTEHSYRTVIQVQPDFYEAFLDTDQNGKRWRRVQMKLEVAVWDSWQEAAHASDGERMSVCETTCVMWVRRVSPLRACSQICPD